MNEIEQRPRNIYQWRSGSRFKADPNDIGYRLASLASESGGHLTTEQIAAEADNLQSPLYPLFEHDMEVAAYEYQKNQARQIAASLVIVTIIPDARNEKKVYENSFITIDISVMNDDDDDDDDGVEEIDGTPICVRALPSVTVNGQTYYTPIASVMSDGVLRDQLAKRYIKELKSMAVRLTSLDIFSDVVDAIKQLPDSDLETAIVVPA